MRSACLLASLLAAGCGGGDDEVVYPTCSQPSEVKIEGTLDGQQISIHEAWSNYGFVNAGDTTLGTFDVAFTTDPAGDRLHLEFDNLLYDGGSVDARGYLDMGAGGGTVAGNCETGGFDSTLSFDMDGKIGTFRLRSLRASPYCSGAAIEGELRGCVVAPMF